MRQHLKNVLVEVNSPPSWPWKQNVTTVVTAVIFLEVVDNWSSVLLINIFFLKKIRLWTLIAFRYRNCMLPLQYLSDWYLHGVYFDRISRGKTSQIERLFETNLKSCGYFKCSTALWLLLDLSSKGNSLTIVGWAFQAQVVTWRPK